MKNGVQYGTTTVQYKRDMGLSTVHYETVPYGTGTVVYTVVNV